MKTQEVSVWATLRAGGKIGSCEAETGLNFEQSESILSDDVGCFSLMLLHLKVNDSYFTMFEVDLTLSIENAWAFRRNLELSPKNISQTRYNLNGS